MLGPLPQHSATFPTENTAPQSAQIDWHNRRRRIFDDAEKSSMKITDFTRFGHLPLRKDTDSLALIQRFAGGIQRVDKRSSARLNEDRAQIFGQPSVNPAV